MPCALIDSRQGWTFQGGNDSCSCRARYNRGSLPGDDPALLVGCALRRNELSELDIATIQKREGSWVLSDLEGKGRRIRTVAAPIWVKQGIEARTATVEISKERLLRSVSKTGTLNRDSLSDWAVWSVVEQSSRQIGKTAAVGDSLEKRDGVTAPTL